MNARPMRLEIYRATKPDPNHYGILDERSPRVPGGWRWRIRSGNGRVLASGESYRRLIDCAHAAGLVTGLALEGVTPGSDYLAGLYDLDGRLRGAPWRITVSS